MGFKKCILIRLGWYVNNMYPLFTACSCTYHGNKYPPGNTIYNTTDGHGNCMTAVCKKDGIIDHVSYPCPVSPPTTKLPTATSTTTSQSPTTFVFTSTTPGTLKVFILEIQDIQLYTAL